MLLHIGYHKTGTSWLQKEIFNQSKLGLYSGLSKKEIQEIFVLPRALHFDADTACVEVGRLVYSRKTAGLVPVISSEELCANPAGGAHLEKELADRLRHTLPEARVLIIIREQRAILASSYKQYVRAGATHTLGTYLDPPSLGDTRAGLPDWRHFSYDALIRYYRHLFGDDQVLVLPYEQFKIAPLEFLSKILNFCHARYDCEELQKVAVSRIRHASLSATSTGLLRRVNKYFGRAHRMNPEPWLKISQNQHRVLIKSIWALERFIPSSVIEYQNVRYERRIAEWIGDRFRESNTATNNFVEADLAKLGYDL